MRISNHTARRVLPVGIDKAHGMYFVYANWQYTACCVLKDTAPYGMRVRVVSSSNNILEYGPISVESAKGKQI